MQLKDFERQIKKDIPLAESLAFEFVSFKGSELLVRAPFLPNRNDKLTVFAGSQASLALLSGWSLLNLLFEAQSVKSVAAVKTDMHYRKPMEKNFLVKAKLSSENTQAQIIDHLQKKGRAKALVDVELMEQDDVEVKAVFNGSYFISLS